MALTKIRTLGSGGFGVVDLVEDDAGAHFARKTFHVLQNLPPQIIENVRRRFAREARTQMGIRHRNIVPVVDGDLDHDPPYYLMPVAVSSLQDDLARDGTLGGAWIAAIADIVAALDELHSMHIYHRDLKTQNVLRFEEGSEQFYAVSDFGLIAMNETRISALTMTGMAKGSDYYTAPEITSDLRRASPQSDIYSLGCIIHDIVGTQPRIPCHEIREDGPYGAILRNCTRTDASRRFKSAKAVLDALISVSVTLPPLTNERTSGFVEQLNQHEPLSEAAWRGLVELVEDEFGSNDARAILVSVGLDQASDLCTRHPELGDRLGQIYARWVHGSSFAFERCDALANVLEVFVDAGSFETKVDCLMAMLELGTSHNRWYVERKFFQLCGPSMDDNLARRLGVEFRAAGSDLCRTIGRAELSIQVSRGQLHPVLAQILEEVCT
ncbi:protein kinase [Microvirga sp. 17 mud 1-3]|uniref:protein kinase domain-containing protein n=1 Tax=Microvirga sp. 17 mud 1-3 TaxID=2082949 RepID=UPI000D6ACAF8|nr:protein kinase [Microvirga sp. 17 mud 1-3]AWM86094.1 hypothetical protein C4E04_04630 [Microvirga sp. 17 mud 1-3]